MNHIIKKSRDLHKENDCLQANNLALYASNVSHQVKGGAQMESFQQSLSSRQDELQLMQSSLSKRFPLSNLQHNLNARDNNGANIDFNPKTNDLQSQFADGKERVNSDDSPPIAMRAGRRTEILKQKQQERQKLQENQSVVQKEKTALQSSRKQRTSQRSAKNTAKKSENPSCSKPNRQSEILQESQPMLTECFYEGGRISEPFNMINQQMHSGKNDRLDKSDSQAFDINYENEAPRNVRKKSSKKGKLRTSNITATTKESIDSVLTMSSPQRIRRGSAKQQQRVNCAPRQSKKQCTNTSIEMLPSFQSHLQKNSLQYASNLVPVKPQSKVNPILAYQVIPQNRDGQMIEDNDTQDKVSPPDEEFKVTPKQKSSIRKKRKNDNVLFEHDQLAQNRASKRITAPFTNKTCLLCVKDCVHQINPCQPGGMEDAHLAPKFQRFESNQSHAPQVDEDFEILEPEEGCEELLYSQSDMIVDQVSEIIEHIPLDELMHVGAFDYPPQLLKQSKVQRIKEKEDQDMAQEPISVPKKTYGAYATNSRMMRDQLILPQAQALVTSHNKYLKVQKDKSFGLQHQRAASCLGQPRVNQSHQQVQSSAQIDPRIKVPSAQYVSRSQNIADIDPSRLWRNISLSNASVPRIAFNGVEHANDIYTWCRNEEAQFYPQVNYMTNQLEINEHMRRILVDWLIDVHVRFRLQTETLHIAVNLTDRFLACRQIRRHEMQLLGVTAMVIAAKYQEIYPPTIEDFVYMTDNACQKRQVITMEELTLQELDFTVNFPTPNYFLEIFTRAIGVPDQPHINSGAAFLLDVAILMHQEQTFLPSTLALSALRLTFTRMQAIQRFANQPTTLWLQQLDQMIARENFPQREVLQCCHVLSNCQQQLLQGDLHAVIRKYRHRDIVDLINSQANSQVAPRGV